MTEKRVALGAELVLPVIALAFAIYFLVSTADLQWEAKANGVIIGSLLVLLLIVQFVRSGIAYLRGRADFSFATLLQPKDVFYKRLGMMAITIALVATVPWLGVGLGLFLSLAAALVMMGVRGYGHALLVAFLVALACSVLFTVVLDSGLPRGPVEHLLLSLVH
ncbi:MAG TPA: hypothetical protein VNS31_10085 [Ramlibacter sp.]|jgi:hypothetical protein|nr:hypothetical protein [Ramlibacter sp.]